MRFLITGGAGFIGSHLSEELLARGDEVHVLDDLSTGAMENVTALKGREGWEYTIESASNTPVVAELVDWSDSVIHLAAAVGVELIVESPVRTIETNVHCTEILLAQASKKKKPVLVASTSEVYGKSTTFPFQEDGDLVMGATTKGRWSYACSKALDEFLAIAYWNERKLPTVVVRLFNTVGPRQTGQYGMVIPTFVQQALAGRSVGVYGDGTQSRCFCHVKDTVRALADLMHRDDAYGEVFNVGGTEEISIQRLAEQVIEATGSESEINLIPYDEAYGPGFEDMARRVPDISKIGGKIGWKPERDLDDILRDVIEHEQGKVVGGLEPTSS